MISVRSSEEAVFPMMSPELSIAAINSPKLCVISGPSEAVNAFQLRCNAVNIPHQPLHTSHAFHSAMVEPVLHLFQEEANAISFSKPGIPIISTVTGTSLSDDDARDPLYWTRHMRLTVRFQKQSGKSCINSRRVSFSKSVHDLPVHLSSNNIFTGRYITLQFLP
jgi:acyl transferase domain-containing protein